MKKTPILLFILCCHFSFAQTRENPESEHGLTWSGNNKGLADQQKVGKNPAISPAISRRIGANFKDYCFLIMNNKNKIH